MYDGLLNHIQKTNVPSAYIRKGAGSTWVYACLLGLGVGFIFGAMT